MAALLFAKIQKGCESFGNWCAGVMFPPDVAVDFEILWGRAEGMNKIAYTEHISDKKVSIRHTETW
jgi:hypothetical protein